MELLKHASDRSRDAAWHLGNLFMSQATLDRPVTEAERANFVSMDTSSAFRYYSQASLSGYTLALHRLGHMHAKGLGTSRSCNKAVTCFKSFVEQVGHPAAKTVEAHRLYSGGHVRQALVMFAQLASIGRRRMHGLAFVHTRKCIFIHRSILLFVGYSMYMQYLFFIRSSSICVHLGGNCYFVYF